MSDAFITSDNRPDVTSSLVTEPVALADILDLAIYRGLLKNGSPVIALQTYTPSAVWEWIVKQPVNIATDLTRIADDKKDGSDGSEGSEGSEAKEGKDDSGSEDKEGSDGSEWKETCDTDPMTNVVRTYYRIANAVTSPVM